MKNKETTFVIDTESLALDERAVILSLALVPFSWQGKIQTPDHYAKNSLYIELDKNDQIENYARNVSHDTVKWWENQSEEARKVLNPDNPLKLVDAIEQISQFLELDRRPVLYPYARGTDFDITKLSSIYSDVNKKLPYKYNSVRDIRSIISTYMDIPGIGALSFKPGIFDNFTAHNALGDAINDVLMMKYLREICNGTYDFEDIFEVD